MVELWLLFQNICSVDAAACPTPGLRQSSPTLTCYLPLSVTHSDNVRLGFIGAPISTAISFNLMVSGVERRSNLHFSITFSFLLRCVVQDCS